MSEGRGERGHQTALELALDAWGEVRAEREARQLDLFAGPPGDPSQVADLPAASERRGRGRPPGARNRRSDELAAWYIAKNEGRDPLERGIEVAGLPVLAKGVIEGLAERLGCTRFEAAKFWAGVLATTLPYVAQKQATIEIKPDGAPGSGQPILWAISEEGGLEILHEPQQLPAPTNPPPADDEAA